MENKPIIALNTNVLAEIKEERKLNIVLPENANSIDTNSKIIVIGFGKECKQVKLGDCIVAIPRDFVKVDIDGKQYLSIKEDDIICVLRGKEGIN